MKKKPVSLLLLLLAMGNFLLSQDTRTNGINQISISSLKQRNTDPFSTEKVKAFRQSNSIKMGSFYVMNETSDVLEVLFYHSDAPKNAAQFKIQVVKNGVKFLLDKNGGKIFIGNDWGIQFRQGNWQSSVFFIGDLCSHNGNGFELRVNNKTSTDVNVKSVEQEDPVNFKKSIFAINYLENNYDATTEKKEGQKWVDILAFYYEDEDYLEVAGKLIGNVPESYIEELDEEAILKMTKKSESFKPIGIAWNKIQQLRVERDIKGDHWLIISGPVVRIEDNKLIANQLRLFIWPEKTDNIIRAISFLSKNLARELREAEEEEARKKREEQQELQEQRNFDNYRFTSVSEATSYLNKVLIAETSHARSVKEKPVIPYPNQYILMPAKEENYQARYFSFSTIRQIEHVSERTPGCPGCGDIDLIKVTVPVYWFDRHDFYSNDFYFTVSDNGVEKAIQALRYLKENASFGEPAKKGSGGSTPETPTMYEVYFQNQNDFDVYVAYASDEQGDGRVVNHYWYKFTPGQKSILFRAKNRAFCYYVYGYSNGRKVEWGNGDRGSMLIDGKAKDATCKVIPERQYRYTFSVSRN